MQPNPVPAGERSLAVDVIAAFLTITFVAFLLAPRLTLSVLTIGLIGIVAVRYGARTIAQRLDGLDRSMRVPGGGRLDVCFSTR